MHKRFNTSIFLIGLLASAVPDLLSHLLKVLKDHPSYHTTLTHFLEIARPYPWLLLVFSLSFGFAAVACQANRGFGPSGLIQFVLLAPVGTWMIRFVLLIVSGALVKYGIPMSTSNMATEIVGTLFVLGVAGSVGIEVGLLGYALGAILTAGIILHSAPPYNFLPIQSFYYTLLGAILSYYMAVYYEQNERP